MSPMNSGKRNRWILRILGFIGAVTILMALAYASKSDKKEDKPSGPLQNPVASLAPSPGALKADATDNARRGCTNLTSVRALAAHLQQSLHLDPISNSGSDATSTDFLLCNYYGTNSNAPVAQTSYATLTSKGLRAYWATYANKDDSLVTRKLSAAQLPPGADDGYEFTPAALSADLRSQSMFRNSGATLRMGNQIVTISFAGFDKLTDNLKKDWEYTVVKAAPVAHQE